jgi:hypothetical protein
VSQSAPRLAGLRSRLPRQVRAPLRNAVDFREGLWPLDRAYRTLQRRAPARPEGFHDKVLFRMAWDRRPLLTTLVDKAASRDYVAARVGHQYLPAQLGLWDDAAAVPFDELPTDAAIKATHGSGGVIVRWSGAPRGTRLPGPAEGPLWSRHQVHPDDFDADRARALLRLWLGQSYEHGPHRLPEWAYRDVPHRVMAEEVLGRDGLVARDLKIDVFDGVASHTCVVEGRFVDRRAAMMTRDWTMRDTPYPDVPLPDRPPERPGLMDEAYAVAEELGRGLDYVRVDIYDLGDRIVVGELTVYPAGGAKRFEPPSFELEQGRRWTLAPEVVEAAAVAAHAGGEG